MTTPPRILFAEVCARLPLFDGLPTGAVERLAAAGLGRGLLTAALRARLRKAGYADMGMLALAAPADLMAVRKIGPVRVRAIRAHVLDAFARLYPGARACHGEDATAARRLVRLHAIPVSGLHLEAVIVDRLGGAGETCADLVLSTRTDSVRPLRIPAADIEEIITALARSLCPDHPLAVASPAVRESDASEAKAARERAELLRERDREWDEAAPARRPRAARNPAA